MQSYVQALGLLDKGVCNYCHVDGRASDEKMQKVIARNMIMMVREINARFPDGKQHVTCSPATAAAQHRQQHPSRFLKRGLAADELQTPIEDNRLVCVYRCICGQERLFVGR